MIKITIKAMVDTDALTKRIETTLQQGMRDLMMEAYGVWKDAAGRALNTTRDAYKDAIQHKMVDPNTVQLYLQSNDQRDHFLVNALEAGHGPMLPWRATLAGRKAFYWSPMAKVRKPGGYKFESLANRKIMGPYKPFMDVPRRDRPKGEPTGYRRLTAENSKKWTHLGFKPKGKGGLDKPLREEVIEFVKKEAPQRFRRLLDRVTV
jgi:hypothetical protein